MDCLQMLKMNQKETKVYIIKYLDKRYNNKKFLSYEEARKYVRRLLTKKFGNYSDSYRGYGFQISIK